MLMMFRMLFALVVLCFTMPSFAEAVGPVITHDCNIAWTAPTLDINGNTLPPGNITKYNVYVGVAPGVYSPAIAVPGSSTATTCSAMGIKKNGQYYVNVSAQNSIGEGAKDGEFPFVLNVIGIPASPSSVTVN